MSGFFSSTPAQGPLRLLVGTHVLALVQTALILQSTVQLPFALRALLITNLILGVTALLVALRGERQMSVAPWWSRRHGR